MARDLTQRVGEILHGYNMLFPGVHLGVAVSGGADSIVLLHVLHRLLQETDQRLTVLHVNHQLRAAESDADEQFVAELAASLRCPFLRTSGPVAKGNVEQEARRCRQHFFQTCKHEYGIDRIALGHTRSDQAETVLFRLLRGSGLTGLAGMAPVTRSGLIRPLLFTSREEIREFARTANLTWREDSSNGDLRFRRNSLRLLTLPQLSQDYNPKLEEGLARIAELAHTEESFWNGRIAKLFQAIVTPVPPGLTLEVNRLRQLHLAQQRRLLRKSIFVLRKSLRSIDSSHIDAILRICRSGHGHDRVMIPGVDAIRSFDTLLLTKPETMKQPREYQLPLLLPAVVDLPFQAGRVIIKQVNTRVANCVTVENPAGSKTEQAYLDCSILKSASSGGSVVVRNWEPGDKFQRISSSSPEKIKTLFQENRIVLWERRHWPVLVVNGEIAWVRHFGAAAKFCPSLNSTSLFEVSFEPGGSGFRLNGK